MAWKKSLLSLTALSMGMSLELAAISIGSAQAGVGNSMLPRTWQVSQFNPPDRGAPNTGVAGATRGVGLLCGEVTPLSPKDVSRDYGAQTPPYFGLTVTEQPTLLFDVAGTSQYSGAPVYFEILELNEQGAGNEVIYSTDFNLPTTSGVIGVPADVVLEEGKSYLWYMEMTCNPNSTSETSGIYGSMERVKATEDLTRQLNMAKTPEDRSRVYGEAGIWFNALETLAQARMAEDTPELDASWKALLQAIDLPEANKERIVNSPLIDCCTVESASEESGLTTHN